MTVCILQRRPSNTRALCSLEAAAGGKLSALELQLLSSRGDVGAQGNLAQLLSTPLADLEQGALRIAQAITNKDQVVVVADYDCDGATSCAVAVAGLRALGTEVGYVVPDRMVHGYGISPSVVDLARERFPRAKVLLTVDNGIMGHSGILHANSLGMDVVVTDHHLAGETLPQALAVIDPARPDCPSQLPKLAGVGVALWLVSAVKRVLTAQGRETPKLNFLLPYVAVGTVADMVGLDASNRQLINAGLNMIRLKEAPVGIQALIKEADLVPAYLTTTDIGFQLGPRINAAGRLDTMDAGIELLLATDPKLANRLARQLTETNEERKRLQKEAVDDVSYALDFTVNEATRAIVKGCADWHPGIVGLVASRIKEKFNRPAWAFSLADGGAKGSGRSIAGFHLKDALEEVARRAPGVLAKFGGHAAAAGATLRSADDFDVFARVFDDVARERITPDMLDAVLWSDGAFPELSLQDAARILRHPWGQGFEPPAFDDEAILEDIKPLGKTGQHWKAAARVAGKAPVPVVMFNQPEPVAKQTVRLYLQPNLNTWKGETRLQWQARVC